MRQGDVCLGLGVEPVAYTKAVRAAALPWNQRRERRAAASTSELDRPAACLNSETPETAWGTHGPDHVPNDSNGQKYETVSPCQVPHGKRSPARRWLEPRGLTGNVGV